MSRNLAKHPITIDEMRRVLNRLADHHAETAMYGDITVATLRAAAARLQRLQFANEPERVKRRSEPDG